MFDEFQQQLQGLLERTSEQEVACAANVQAKIHMDLVCEQHRKAIEELRDKLHSQQLAAIENEAATRETLRDLERDAIEAVQYNATSVAAKEGSMEAMSNIG